MLAQGKDDDKEKRQNSRREECYTLSIGGIKESNRFLRSGTYNKISSLQINYCAEEILFKNYSVSKTHLYYSN